MKKKLKEVKKDNSPNKEVYLIKQYNSFKNANQDYRKIKLVTKNNLPELKFAKLKLRHDSDSFNFKNIYHSNANKNNNITNANDSQNQKLSILSVSKNHPIVNKNDLIFPKIFNPLKKNFYKQEKNNNDSSNSLDNQCSNSNNNRSINTNYMKNHVHLMLGKMPNKRKKEIINKNLSEIHRIQNPSNYSFSPNNKKYNKQNSNIENNKFRLHFLLQPIQKNHIPNPILNISSSANNIHSDKNNNNSINNFNHGINIKLNNSINIKSLYTKKLKQSASANTVNVVPKENHDSDNITDRNNKNIKVLINKLSPIASPSLINKSQNFGLNSVFKTISKTISIPIDILHKSFLGFEDSITSYYSEFSPPIKSIIKGYAYNTNKGNIRNYNEDTICVQKINSKIEQIFYFFGIFDGHGGKGCSSFLQENLHKYIQDFSIEGLKDAIYKSENEFLSKYAIDSNNNLKDASGSCGVMAIIKQNKLIIANIGDSRIILFKSGKLFFQTEDHKPNIDREKERIKNAGGQIYQSQSIQAKSEKFGGKSGVIIPSPDITELDLDENYDFMVIGCDGIFDVISNEQIFDIWKIVINEERYKNFENKEIDINALCGDFADAIIKSSLFKNSYDNVSCIVVVFNLNKYNFDLNQE